MHESHLSTYKAKKGEKIIHIIALFRHVKSYEYKLLMFII
jgi:hypothetical protein